MSNYEDAADQCAAEHTDYRDSECDTCTQHADEYRQCSDCLAVWEDGEWWTTHVRVSQVNGCAHETVMDFWGHELACTVRDSSGVRCGDPVTPAGTACDFHQRWLDQQECARVYQRLVAVR